MVTIKNQKEINHLFHFENNYYFSINGLLRRSKGT